VQVAVADDGALFREGLVLLLRAAGHEVVAAVPDGDALVEVVERRAPDVAVLDIRMPPGQEGGLSTASTLRARFPDLPLLVLSHYGEAHYLRRILEIGTRRIGYRIKDEIASPATLSDTLGRLVEGEMVIEPSVAGHLMDRPVNGGRLAGLGPREKDVLRLMAEGRSNQNIAGLLHVSVKAVEKHTAGLFTKLDLPADANAYHRRVLAVLAYLES
jgi:DNA-binding NarL/FixJ family response regulator